jgi:hypothetical protein
MPQPERHRTGLTRDETRASLRRFNWNAGLRGAFETVCGGSTFIFVAFASSLGLSKERMGGILAVLALRDAPMPSLAANAAPRLADLPAVLRTPPFVRVVAVMLLFNVPFFFACPYYQVFHLEIARMPASMIALMQTGYLAVKIVSLPALGRLLERWGPSRTLFATGFVYAPFFATYPLCGPGVYWPIMAGWAVVALADAAFGLAIQAALYGSVPDSRARPAYFAVYNFTSLVGYGIGSVLAVPALEAIREVRLQVGPLALGHFHLLYAACTLLMFPCLFAARLIKSGTRRSRIRDQTARRCGPGRGAIRPGFEDQLRPREVPPGLHLGEPHAVTDEQNETRCRLRAGAEGRPEAGQHRRGRS